MNQPKPIPISNAQLPRLEEELELPDGEFTSVRISEFYSPRVVIFDLFLKLGSGRYLKIFRTGENYSEEELRIYEAERGVKKVFFSRKHRSAYVTTSTTLLQKVTPVAAVPLKMKFGVARILSELYIQELFESTNENRAALVERGKVICSTIAAWIEVEPGLEDFILKLEHIDSNKESISFLTGIMACIASRHYPWKSVRTSETLLLAAFLSDIGIFQLSPAVQRLSPKKMKKEQKEEFQTHPEASYSILKGIKSTALNQSILDIIREHHEYCDGSGFPNKITGGKTLVLSKLMVVCGDLIRISSEFLLPPSQAINIQFPIRTDKLVAEHPEIAGRYDSKMLKEFFQIFDGKIRGVNT